MFLFYLLLIKKSSDQNMNINGNKHNHSAKAKTHMQGKTSQTLPLIDSNQIETNQDLRLDQNMFLTAPS